MIQVLSFKHATFPCQLSIFRQQLRWSTLQVSDVITKAPAFRHPLSVVNSLVSTCRLQLLFREQWVEAAFTLKRTLDPQSETPVAKKIRTVVEIECDPQDQAIYFSDVRADGADPLAGLNLLPQLADSIAGMLHAEMMASSLYVDASTLMEAHLLHS